MSTEQAALSAAEHGQFNQRVLPNGLQLLGQYMEDVQSVSACFYVRTGGRDEEPEVSGVSHFLEHMTFKGTPTRSYEDINREFETIGAENNAGTGHEFTYFYAKVLREYVPQLVDLLTDMMRPRLDAADFAQERSAKGGSLFTIDPSALLRSECLLVGFSD